MNLAFAMTHVGAVPLLTIVIEEQKPGGKAR
jgi:hypothetical protein